MGSKVWAVYDLVNMLVIFISNYSSFTMKNRQAYRDKWSVCLPNRTSEFVVGETCHSSTVHSSIRALVSAHKFCLFFEQYENDVLVRIIHHYEVYECQEWHRVQQIQDKCCKRCHISTSKGEKKIVSEKVKRKNHVFDQTSH